MTNETTALDGAPEYANSQTEAPAPAKRGDTGSAGAGIRSRVLALDLQTVRAGIALLGAIAALAVWFLLAPAPLDAHGEAASHDGLVSAVRSEQAANELTADSAPQQTVVNTWATVDMLEVVTTQLDDLAGLQAASAPDSRIPGLLLIGVLVLCLSRVAESLVGARRSAA